VSFGGSAGVGGFGARCGLAIGLAAVLAIGFTGSASAADDPLGAVTQAATSATNAAAPTVTTAAAGATETASATTAAAQTATKSVHPPARPAEREVSETVRSAGAAVDSAVRTAKGTADSAVATTTRVVSDATRPPAPTAGGHITPATHSTRAGLKVEASHARPPSRHPGVTPRRTAEPRTSPATAARALDLAPAPHVAVQSAHRDVLSPAAATSRGERASGPQPLSPTAPLHGGAAAAGASAAASGAGIAALLLATFILAAPAIRRRLHAPPPGHWPAAPVFLLERPG
jgi:hypothetical protein